MIDFSQAIHAFSIDKHIESCEQDLASVTASLHNLSAGVVGWQLELTKLSSSSFLLGSFSRRKGCLR